MRLFSFEQIDCITTHLQTVLKTQTASELFLKLAPFFAWAIKPRTHPKGGPVIAFCRTAFTQPTEDCSTSPHQSLFSTAQEIIDRYMRDVHVKTARLRVNQKRFDVGPGIRLMNQSGV